MQLTIVSSIVIQREILQSQFNTIRHCVSLKLTTELQIITRTSYEYCVNQVHVSHLFFKYTVKFTHTHFTSQGNELTFISTQYIVRQVKQEVFQQFSCQTSIITSVRRSNLFQQTSTDKCRTTILTFQITRTIFVYVVLIVYQSSFKTFVPLTHCNPFLECRPQIRSFTSLRIFQSYCHNCRVSRTCDIIRQTYCSQIVTHLEVSIVVQDISLFTIFFISRSQTVYLATRS